MQAVSRRMMWAPVALWIVGGSTTPLAKRQEDLVNFNWTSIAPSQDLQYHECYNGYRCARLKVPLDWTTAKNASTSWTAIGIVTLPATVPDSDPSFGGTVLINPGGPGGAGTEMALDQGKYLQGILDGEKHYEILGFDPRGVGTSTPSASCYTDDLNRLADAVQLGGMPPVGSGDIALNLHYQAAAGFGELCGQTVGQDSIFVHMSTASVARDMLEIVERADDLRRPTTSSMAQNDQNKPLLQYIGVSYGTILGNTFASMFPRRVGRMVLDGVADADDYISGTWKKNLDDAEVVTNHFYQTCFQAGDLCPLRQERDQSAANVRQRVDAFIHSLESNPVSAIQDGRVRLVTSLVIRDAIRQTLYNPICAYEDLAIALAHSIFRANHTLILASGGSLCTRPVLTHAPIACPWCTEATFGVLCGDSAAASTRDKRNASWARGEADFLLRQSQTTGEPWSRIPLSCVSWPFAPKYGFGGPFESQVPLLVLSNRYDHATPLANAYALSRRHKGSAVVVQESFGHCALLTSTSKCTAEIVREYFASGKLPANGTACAQDCTASIPFKPCPGIVE